MTKTNPYSLKIKLKQHTPMIHFQSNHQAGATLRATELKPKLDKFLISDCFEDKFDDYKTLLVGYNGQAKKDIHPALDYKVKIRVGDVSISSVREKYPCFFANIGKGVEEKFFSFATNIMIEFFSLKTELIEKIKENLPDFLMSYNFGTRQSKGFGSFYIDRSDSLYANIELGYSFNVDVSRARNEGKKIEEVFRQIELFYKCLRSGINLIRGNKTFYCKSLIFKYAKEKLGIQWEKKKIKQEFFLQDMKDQMREHNNPDTLLTVEGGEYLVKDLLGLSTNENWRSYKAGITKKHKNGEIDRFKSPIFFKPMRLNDDTFKVYFDVDVFDEKIFGQTFEIRTKGARNAIKLDTPKDFDYYDFLDFVCKVNISKHIDFDYHDTDEFEILDNIFNQF